MDNARIIIRLTKPSLLASIRRGFLWVRQLFGSRCVQSPSVYAFVTNVLRNRTAYYAYRDRRKQLEKLSRRQRKMAKLLFRLANATQASSVQLPASCMHYSAFILSGCSSTRINVSNTADTIEFQVASTTNNVQCSMFNVQYSILFSLGICDLTIEPLQTSPRGGFRFSPVGATGGVSSPLGELEGAYAQCSMSNAESIANRSKPGRCVLKEQGCSLAAGADSEGESVSGNDYKYIVYI